MKLIRILLFVLLPVAGFSQIQGEDEVYLNGDRIDAKFNGGGLDKFHEFINKEFDYSKVTKSGKLEATFTIDEQGNLTKIKITQVLDVESATEFIRVLKKSPKWEPASLGGKPISIEIKYPMVFKQKREVPLIVTPMDSEKTTDEDQLYNTAGIEKNPEFPGGLQEFYKYIGKSFKAPSNVSGKVFLTFVIEKDGSITNVKVLRDIGYGTGEEAVRVLKNSPNWIPGELNGKKVRVLFSLPISIQPAK